MKQIIGLTVLFLFVGFTAMAQSYEVNVSEDKTSEMSIEECAKKNGMTVAECKAKCKTSCAKSCKEKTASADASGNAQVLSVMAEGESKSCCGSLAECAKKMGMSLAECKAKCDLVHKGETTEEAKARVASATYSRTEAQSTPLCKKSSKACCKKTKQ